MFSFSLTMLSGTAPPTVSLRHQLTVIPIVTQTLSSWQSSRVILICIWIASLAPRTLLCLSLGPEEASENLSSWRIYTKEECNSESTGKGRTLCLTHTGPCLGGRLGAQHSWEAMLGWGCLHGSWEDSFREPSLWVSLQCPWNHRAAVAHRTCNCQRHWRKYLTLKLRRKPQIE